MFGGGGLKQYQIHRHSVLHHVSLQADTINRRSERFLVSCPSFYLFCAMHSSFSRLSGRLSLLVFCLLIALGCKKNDDTVASPQTIPDRIREDSRFSFLRAVIDYANVSDALKAGNLTLFAPTDSAFQASGFTSIAALAALSKEQARQIVLYHVLTGAVTADKIPGGLNAVATAGNGTAYFNRATDGTVYINNAKVTQTDLKEANGYIHTIDRVLTPSTGDLLTTIQNNPNLTFLSAAIKRVGTSDPALLAALMGSTSASTVTIFAPNDDAFKAHMFYNSLLAIESADPKTLANTLLYHATSGVLFSNQLKSGPLSSLAGTNKFTVTVSPTQTTVKGTNNTTAATIKQANLPATNGVIHIIDKVLQP